MLGLTNALGRLPEQPDRLCGGQQGFPEVPELKGAGLNQISGGDFEKTLHVKVPEAAGADLD